MEQTIKDPNRQLADKALLSFKAVKKMLKVTIDKNRCKGCELCTDVCPKGVLTMSKDCNNNGYSYATVQQENKCIGCLFCVKVCPDICLEIGKAE